MFLFSSGSSLDGGASPNEVEANNFEVDDDNSILWSAAQGGGTTLLLVLLFLPKFVYKCIKS